MTPIRHLLCLLLASTLGACANSPPASYFTLDDGETSASRSPEGAGVAIVQVDLPELIDRPQLVVRTAGNQVQFSEQHRWAEPLRSQIRRVMARDLCDALESAHVAGLGVGTRGAPADVRIRLDIQRFEAVAGKRVDLVASWHVKRGNTPAFTGHWSHSEEIAAGVQTNDYSSMVAAHRRALRRLADSLGANIGSRPGRTAAW